MKFRLSSILSVIAVLGVLTNSSAHAGRTEGIEAYSREDWPAAYKELKPLADTNDPIAQYYLASMYFNGWGVKQNDKEMVRLFKASAEAGFPSAQFPYGVLHLVGQRGIEKNETVAVQWIRRAADKGILEAVQMVGSFYQKGVFYQKDFIEACAWYETATLLGYSPSSGKCQKIVNDHHLTDAQIEAVVEIAKKRAQKIKAAK